MSTRSGSAGCGAKEELQIDDAGDERSSDFEVVLDDATTAEMLKGTSAGVLGIIIENQLQRIRELEGVLNKLDQERKSLEHGGGSGGVMAGAREKHLGAALPGPARDRGNVSDNGTDGDDSDLLTGKAFGGSLGSSATGELENVQGGRSGVADAVSVDNARAVAADRRAVEEPTTRP